MPPPTRRRRADPTIYEHDGLRDMIGLRDPVTPCTSALVHRQPGSIVLQQKYASQKLTHRFKALAH
jgi:hypothetical protein